MSTDEQDQELGRAVRQLREKDQERRCLMHQAGQVVSALNGIIEAHKQDHYGSALQEQLDALPSDEDVLAPFRSLLKVKGEIADLLKLLDLPVVE